MLKFISRCGKVYRYLCLRRHLKDLYLDKLWVRISHCEFRRLCNAYWQFLQCSHLMFLCCRSLWIIQLDAF